MQERFWQAIVANDAAYDGTFYYAVATTGIFCRPSCKSRLPKREHVRIFHTSAKRRWRKIFVLVKGAGLTA